MIDIVRPQRRSEIMSNIRAKGTKPEMTVRRLIHSMGYRYRLHRADLPGTPDLVFPSRRKLIFVHGCFWHQHKRCGAARIPKSNRDYWEAKLNRNVARDRAHQSQLRRLGWQVLVIWECDIRTGKNLTGEIERFLNGRVTLHQT